MRFQTEDSNENIQEFQNKEAVERRKQKAERYVKNGAIHRYET